MDTARAELGPDALLMNTRESPPEARHLGEYEVVFGVRPSTQPAPAVPAVPDPVRDLQHQMEALRAMVTKMRPASEREPAGKAWVEDALYRAGITRTLARDIDSVVQQRL